MISLLFEGLHDNHYGDGFYDIDPLTSSVTLIRNQGLTMLVDTGTPKFFPLLKEKLKEYKLTPADINYIFCTHFHLDHSGCAPFFPNAQVWVGRSFLDYKTGRARVFTNEAFIQYPGEIEMIFTPGHTFDHASYKYTYQGVRYVCAGDAVREDIIRHQTIPKVHLPDQFVPTMKKIFESADVIIPGHGRIIEGSLKDELYTLVCGEWKQM